MQYNFVVEYRFGTDIALRPFDFVYGKYALLRRSISIEDSPSYFFRMIHAMVVFSLKMEKYVCIIYVEGTAELDIISIEKFSVCFSRVSFAFK